MPKEVTTKTFAEIYWREFERLSVQLISDQYGIKPDLILVTRPSKDGGYDGVIETKLTKQGSFFNLRDRTLIQAKLLRENRAPDLNGVLAPMIIAFNLAANTLVLVSNNMFSSTARLHGETFHSKSNLKIEFVDGNKVRQWVVAKASLLEREYPKGFLEGLTKSSQNKRNRYHPVRHINQNDAVITERFPEIQTTKVSFTPFGRKRRKLVDELTKALALPGIAVLNGAAGVGKSVIVDATLQNLEKQNCFISTIDMQKCQTNRLFFLKILEAFWGIDPIVVMDSKAFENNLDLIIGCAGGKKTSKKMMNAVLSIFNKSISHYNDQKDIYNHLLVQFLTNVIEPHSSKRNILFVFQNLNRAYPETLDFVYAVSIALESVGVRILLELRDSGFVEELIDQNEWRRFVTRFQSAQSLGNFRVEQFDESEAIEYLVELLPGLGRDRYKIIQERVGNIPLFLYSAAHWLKQNSVVSNVSIKHYVVRDLETFFTDISPADCIPIIDNLIGIWRENVTFPMADCMAAAILMDGHLNLPSLACLVPDIAAAELAEKVIQTGIFKNDLNSISVLHDLMFDRMQRIFKDTPRLAMVANILASNIEKIVGDPQTKKLKAIELNYIAGNMRLIGPKAMNAATELTKSNQFEHSTKYFNIAYGAFSCVTNERDKTIGKIRSLVEWLEAEIVLSRIANDENGRKLAELMDLIHFSPSFTRKRSYELRTQLVNWHKRFLPAEYQTALKASRDLVQYVETYHDHLDEELCGRAYWAHALSMKKMGQYEEALKIFKTGMKLFPESITLYAGYLSHVASYNLKHTPAEALRNYKKLLSATKGTDYIFSEIIHARVDVAMAEFLCHNYKRCFNSSVEAFSIAQANGVRAEEGRALNIIGCCHWVQGSLQLAANSCDKAAFALENSLSYTYLWRVRTNLTGIYLELEERDKSLVTAHSAVEDILNRNANVLNHIAVTKDFSGSRIYIALLALGTYFHELRSKESLVSLIRAVPVPEFQGHLHDIRNKRFPNRVFSGTSHIHAGKIIITG